MIDGKNDKGGSEGTLFVGAGVTLRGDVEVPGSASVDGRFEGTLKAKTLIVGQSGHVSGQISAETAEIRGMVDDQLVVRNKLVLRASGSISGAISYSKIMVEEGGSISGSIEVMERPRAVAQPAAPEQEARILQLHQNAK
jgi:cytoskeletal protein CcmA (bactofilin family)